MKILLPVLCAIAVVCADTPTSTSPKAAIRDYRARLARIQRNQNNALLKSTQTVEGERVESYDFPPRSPSVRQQSPSYKFGYVVKNQDTLTNFGRQEKKNGSVTEGSYRVSLPDGRLQIVTYKASPETGNVVNVKYIGEARYPTTVAPKKPADDYEEKVKRNTPAAAAATYSELETRLSELVKRHSNKRTSSLRYPVPSAYRKLSVRPLA